MADICTHADDATDAEPSGNGCKQCLLTGGRWVHLRLCMSCGEVGCCDSSPNKHASKHAASTDHPLVESFEPGEDWWWCYVDEVGFTMPELPTHSHT